MARPRINAFEEASPFKIDGDYCRFLRLSRGLIAIVDEADYAAVGHLKWTAHRDTTTGGFYAERHGSVSLARTLLGIASGDRRIADHINGNRLDNRRGNLRIVTPQQSAQNRRFKGVTQKSKNSWQARIMVNGINKHLGSFASECAAIAARRAAEIQNFGEFARKGEL